MKTLAGTFAILALALTAFGQVTSTNTRLPSSGLTGVASTNSSLFQHSYRLSTNAFPKMRILTKAGKDQSDREVFLSYCKSKGLDLSPPDSTLCYMLGTQDLVVRSQWDKLQKLDKILKDFRPPK